MAADRLTTGSPASPQSSLMERMMIHSDNRATDILIRDLGGPAGSQDWVRFQRALQFARRPDDCAVCSPTSATLWDARDSSTPLAMVDLLRRLDKGNVLKPESRSYLMDLMGRCATGKNRIRRPAPVGNAGRAQDRHPERLHQRRRLHHLAERSSELRSRMFARGGDRSSPDDRRGRAGHLRRLHPAVHLADLRRSDTLGARPKLRCCSFTSSPAEKSADRRKAELVERYLKRIAWPTKLTELPSERAPAPAVAGSDHPSCSTKKARRFPRWSWRQSLSIGATAARAKRAS